MDLILELDDFFVTSDTWFGRSVISEKRNFEDIDIMHTTLIRNWNKVVKKNDVVLHLGNFGTDPNICNKVLNKLNGFIYLLYSNDDHAIFQVKNDFKNIKIKLNQILTIPKQDAVFCHYPLLDWPGKKTGTLNIHGGNYGEDFIDFDEFRVNVSTDYWNYTPIKITVIKELMYEKTKENK